MSWLTLGARALGLRGSAGRKKANREVGLGFKT